MSQKQIQNEYLNWLLWRVGFDMPDYNKLIYHLYSTNFIYVIERDINRVGDGLILRDYFERDTGAVINDAVPVSVLEVLIGISIRITDDYIGDPSNPNPEAFFIEMMHNLNLFRYADHNFSEKIVDQILNKWMYREFDPDGKGSILPLDRPSTDQRSIEIWSQLQEYLYQNY